MKEQKTSHMRSRRKLRKARLPERCRTVLVLHDVEGFTHEEISRQLEIAVGTSKSQLFDARRAIRQYLIPKRMEMPHA